VLSLFLLLLLAAVVLGLIGVLAKGLLFLLFIGIVVFVADLVLVGVRAGRRHADVHR
jgi:hypothetical protein